MNWTKEMPTESGAYWMRSRDSEPSIVSIVDGTFWWGDSPMWMDAPWLKDAEWYGPLLPPLTTDGAVARMHAAGWTINADGRVETQSGDWIGADLEPLCLDGSFDHDLLDALVVYARHRLAGSGRTG